MRFPILLAAMLAAAQACAADESWAVYGQATTVAQQHGAFRSPYSGQNSLDPRRGSEETTDLTLYAGVRLWQGGELWLNPEIDQGRGLSDTVGAAGFPSGEAYKIGANAPYLRLPRAFVRHVVELGGEGEAVEAAPNQLAGQRAAGNLTITVGHFSVGDVFDANSYAHDPRADFLNWALIDSGAFDYAADAWGYTWGAALEWNTSSRSWRAGAFQLSDKPNGKIVRPSLGRRMLVVELEQRYQLGGRAGKARVFAFANRAPMGGYDDAIAAAGPGGVPDTAVVRHWATRSGAGLNIEQEITPDVGAFLRLSANGGAKEAYEFTEINRSLAVGVALRGAAWGRAADTAGIAVVANALSDPARRYFARGGIGILIGDGGLDYGGERITEAYYAFQLTPAAALSFDAQRIVNPAYNGARGPVNVFGLRLHLAGRL